MDALSRIAETANLEGLALECGYIEEPGDGEDDGGVDALIDYKNALEVRLSEIAGLATEATTGS